MSPVVFPRICYRSCPQQPTRSPNWSATSLWIVQVGSDSDHLLKANLSSLAPVIDDIVNVSIATGVFHSAFKKALVINSVAEENNAWCKWCKELSSSVKPVFCVQNVEKVVVVHFSKHLSDNDLFELMQAAYRPNHSTETARTADSTQWFARYTRWAQGCHTSSTRSIGSIWYDRSHNHVNQPQRSVWNNCNMSCMV